MKEKFLTRVLAEIAIFSALALVLDILEGGICRGVWINGGSIGIAMIPVIIVCYRRGFLPGLLCGFIVSILQMLGGVYSLAMDWYKVIAQIMLDYIIAYPLVALCGLFAKPYHKATTSKEKVMWLSIGIGLGGTLKFLSHFLSGVLFWPAIEWNGASFASAGIYSLVYNGSFMLPNIVIAIVIVSLIAVKQPKILDVNYTVVQTEKHMEQKIVEVQHEK